MIQKLNFSIATNPALTAKLTTSANNALDSSVKMINKTFDSFSEKPAQNLFDIIQDMFQKGLDSVKVGGKNSKKTINILKDEIVLKNGEKEVASISGDTFMIAKGKDELFAKFTPEALDASKNTEGKFSDFISYLTIDKGINTSQASKYNFSKEGDKFELYSAEKGNAILI